MNETDERLELQFRGVSDAELCNMLASADNLLAVMPTGTSEADDDDSIPCNYDRDRDDEETFKRRIQAEIDRRAS